MMCLKIIQKPSLHVQIFCSKEGAKKGTIKKLSSDWQVQATTEIGSRLRFKVNYKVVFEIIRAGKRVELFLLCCPNGWGHLLTIFGYCIYICTGPRADYGRRT